MSKQYAVLHIEKGKGSGGALGHHIDRTQGKEYSYKHSDPDLKHLNSHFKLNAYCSMPLQDAIKERIKDGYTSKRKINDNAVTHLKIVLTGSHERMKELETNGQGLKEWVIENKKFLEEKYGAQNIIRFTLHRDEKTPHLHAVIVPLTQDGRLSAFEVLGNKTKMKNLQNDYAAAMAPFGLERGLENTGIKHEDAKAYYARMEKANDIANKTEINVSKNLLGGYKSESVEELKESVKSLKLALEAKKSIIQSEEKKKEEMNKRLDSYSKNNEVLRNNLSKIIANDELHKKEQDKAIAKLQEELLNAFNKQLQKPYNFSLLDTSEKKEKFLKEKMEKVLNGVKSNLELFEKAFTDSFFGKLASLLTKEIKHYNLMKEETPSKERNRGMRR